MTTGLYVAFAAAFVTLLSGVAALYLRAHKAFIFAFCSGALIGGAVIFLLPDAAELLEQAESTLPPDLLWLVCAFGFLFFYLFDRGSHDAGSARIAGLGGGLGIAMHSFLDGVVIGQGFRAGEEIGWIVTAAVLLHKLADGMSTVSIMIGTEHGTRQTTIMLAITALAPILGVVAQSFVFLPASLLALLLSWFAGMLLYLGASHLLPEARRASSSPAIPFLSVTGVIFVSAAHFLSR